MDIIQETLSGHLGGCVHILWKVDTNRHESPCGNILLGTWPALALPDVLVHHMWKGMPQDCMDHLRLAGGENCKIWGGGFPLGPFDDRYGMTL